jgi:hypothetical protein
MALDLSVTNLPEIHESGYEFELVHPGTKEPLGAFVKVRGDMSKVVKAHYRKRFNEVQQQAKVAKRRNLEVETTLDEYEDLAVQDAVVRVIGWKGIQEEGKDVAFSTESGERILRAHPWIREQIQEAATEVVNFQ